MLSWSRIMLVNTITIHYDQYWWKLAPLLITTTPSWSLILLGLLSGYWDTQIFSLVLVETRNVATTWVWVIEQQWGAKKSVTTIYNPSWNYRPTKQPSILILMVSIRANLSFQPFFLGVSLEWAWLDFKQSCVNQQYGIQVLANLSKIRGDWMDSVQPSSLPLWLLGNLIYEWQLKSLRNRFFPILTRMSNRTVITWKCYIKHGVYICLLALNLEYSW